MVQNGSARRRRRRRGVVHARCRRREDRRGGARPGRRRARGSRVETDSEVRKVSISAPPECARTPGCRRRRLPGARGRGDQHRDHPHVTNQDHLPDPRRGRAAGGVRAPLPRSTSRRRIVAKSFRSASRRAEMSGDGPRIAVVGATGAVGNVMLRCLRERADDCRAQSSHSRPSAPPVACSTTGSSSRR